MIFFAVRAEFNGGWWSDLGHLSFGFMFQNSSVAHVNAVRSTQTPAGGHAPLLLLAGSCASLGVITARNSTLRTALARHYVGASCS